MKYPRVLVTGGAGFIGSHLCSELLDAGHRVTVLDNLRTGRRERIPEGARFVEGDVLDPSAASACTAEADAVIHLAARVGIRNSDKEASEEVRENVLGTLGMIQACRASPVKRFVFASSMAVYSEGTAGQRIREEHPTSPISTYGVCKLAAERIVNSLAPGAGLTGLSLRLFNTYGEGQAFTPEVGVITIFARLIAEGRAPVIYGDGEQVRDFVWVRDVARAARLAMESDAAGCSVNVGSGAGVTVNRIAELVSRAFGREVQFRREPASPAELRYSVADTGLAERLFGYKPTGDLATEIESIVEDMKGRA